MSYKLPSPAPERSSVRGRRQKIVVYLDSLSEKVRELQKLQNETERDLVDLKQSILQKSFSGEL